MGALTGRVAIVAGASRGAGKGIALALGEAGAAVYVVGRTSIDGPKPADGAPGSIEETADAVTRRGGRGIPVRADCTNPCDVAALFDRIDRDGAEIDVLANAVWGAADANQSMDDWMAAWGKPFWEQPIDSWAHMMAGGPYAYYLMSAHAARVMARRRKGGLIVGVTDGYVEGAAPDAAGMGALIWTLSHQCINLRRDVDAGLHADRTRRPAADDGRIEEAIRLCQQRVDGVYRPRRRRTRQRSARPAEERPDPLRRRPGGRVRVY
jgi:NAD(P)-dependent dehydrogenase (short-subunit alcohol dehydrogenase family)